MTDPAPMTDEEKMAAIQAEIDNAQTQLDTVAGEVTPDETPTPTPTPTPAQDPKRRKRGETAVATRRKDATNALSRFLDQRRESLGRWACERVAPDALIRFALMDYSQSEQLQRCTHESIYLALIACAQVGLEPGGMRQEAFIVPFKTHATFILGYRGVITLARRSGLVRRIVGNVVYANDRFDYDEGTDPFVKHKRALGDRGEIVAAYAYAVFGDGQFELEVMAREDLDRVVEFAKRRGASPAYRDWPDQMIRKAPIRRLGKRLPLGADYELAMRLDAYAQGRDVRGYRRTLAETGADVEVLPAGAAIELPRRGNDALRAELGGAR